jgi:hypothetical protein
MGILSKQKAREKEKKLKEKIKLRKEEEELRKKKQTELNKEELKYLIKLIAKTKFDGLEMQTIYIITAKLQNQLKK